MSRRLSDATRRVATIEEWAEGTLELLKRQDAGRNHNDNDPGHKRRGMRSVDLVDLAAAKQQAAFLLDELARLRHPPTPLLRRLISYLLIGRVDPETPIDYRLEAAVQCFMADRGMDGKPPSNRAIASKVGVTEGIIRKWRKLPAWDQEIYNFEEEERLWKNARN